MFDRPRYRARQFFGSFQPRFEDGERAEAAALLGDRLWPLFESMSERDQRHSLDVLAVLRDQGCRDDHVLIAALLHDAGKGRLAGVRIRLWHRVAFVVLSTGAGWAVRHATGRGGMAALRDHAERGAVVAEALGAPADVIDLIRHHDEAAPHDERLRMLREADDAR